MRTLLLASALPLLTQAACAGHRYAVSDELASSRHDRQWRVVHEPPPEPAPVATPAPAATDPAQLPEGAMPPAGAAPSQAAFPEQEVAAAPIENASPAAADGTETETETETATTESAQAEAAPEPAAAAPPPPPVAHARVDLARENESWERAPEKPKLQRMIWGLSMRLGGTFGSEDLLVVEYTDGSTETLTTGGGVNFFLGTIVIPFKVGRHSLGFGFEGGWKFSTIGQGSDTDITFSRKTFMPRVQYGYALNPAIHWIISAGPQYETDVTLQARGGLVGSTKFENTWGYFGETGILLDIGYFGLDLTLRHTRIDYSLPEGPSISGNSIGILCGLQIGLLKTENLSARSSASN